MSSGEKFIATLKRIGYPNADSLCAASFDWMFEDEELRPFLESICSDITDENIVTDNELKEYEALMADKTVDLSVIERMSELMEEDVPEDELQEEMANLEANAAQTEKYIRLLEHQKNVLNMHKLELAQQGEDLETVDKGQRKEIQKLHGEVLPQIISKITAAVKSGTDIINELGDILEEPPGSKDRKTKTNLLFLSDLKPYLETEEQVLQNVSDFLNVDFKKFLSKTSVQIVDESFEAFIPQLSSEGFQKKQASEALRLKNVLKITEEEHIRAVLEVTKLESEIKFCKDLVESRSFSTYDLPDAQLKMRMEKAEQTLKEQQEEQKKLLVELRAAIDTSLDLQVDRVALLCNEEKAERYKAFLEKLQTPLHILVEQRARLEFLMIAMSIEERNTKDVLKRVTALRKLIEAEVSEIEEQKFAEEMENQPVDGDIVEKGSALHVMNEILGSDSDGKLVYLTAGDVLEKVEKLKSEEQKLRQEAEDLLQDQLRWIHIAEKNLNLLDDYVHGKKSKEADHPTMLLEEMSSNLSKLSIQVQELEEKLLKQVTDFHKKKQLISQNSTLAETRKLFVYALTNQEKFKHCVEEIKGQAKMP